MNILPILNTATFGPTPEPATIGGVTYSVHERSINTIEPTVKEKVTATMGNIGAVVYLRRRRSAVTNIIALDHNMYVRHSKFVTVTADVHAVRREVTEHTFEGTARLLGVNDWRLIADDHAYDPLHSWISETLNSETLNRGAF